MSIIEELKRRNVIRVTSLYLVTSWLVLQVADILFDAFDVPSWSMRLLVAILILGCPLVIIFSWIYELTPDGVRRETEAGGSNNPAIGRKINIAIGVLLAVAIGFLVIDRIVPETSSVDGAIATSTLEIPDLSIAVLPFVNISDDPSNEYFSDGLSEELLNMLVGIPELRVTARTSSFSFKNKDTDIPTIGRLLNVANVLEGSVRKSDDQLRITAQLINAKSGYHLWSATYDRKMDDIFAIQDEIAAAVVIALRITILGEAPRARETTPEAFAAYLHGLHFYQQRTNDGYAKAVQYVQQALEIDPEYAPAWTLLGATYSNQALAGRIPFDDASTKALAAVEKALQIDPNFALAISARAWLAMVYERDYAGSAAYFRHALDLAPDNSIILGNAAVLARTLGRIDEAIDMTQRSLALNPVSAVGYVNLSDQLTHAGRPADAVEAARKAIELAPGNSAAKVNLAGAYLLAEQPEMAIEVAEQFDWPFYELLINAMAYNDLGRFDESNDALLVMTDQYADVRAFRIAAVHAWRNDIDSAFDWLYRALDENQPTRGIKTDPFLKNLHDDMRWNPLLASLGLSDEQIGAIRF
jgi:adenylate cyclase